MNKSIEQKFDEKFYKDHRGFVMCKKHKAYVTKPELLEFFDSQIKQAAEEIRAMKLETYKDPVRTEEFTRALNYKIIGINQGLEQAAKHLESLIE